MDIQKMDPTTIAKAQTVINRVEKAAGEVKKLDNGDNQVDLNPQKGEVEISDLDGIIFHEGDNFHKQELRKSRVSFDQESGNTKTVDVTTRRFYDSSYGRSAETEYRFTKKEVVEKDGLFGLFGNERTRTVYMIEHGKNCYFGGEETYCFGGPHQYEVKVDKQTGQIMRYKE